MKVFHGTSLRRCISILSDGSINVTTDENTHYSPCSDYASTKRGSVYLTDSYIAAVEFGLRCWLDDNVSFGFHDIEPEVGVFELEIDDDVLEKDTDESERLNYSTTIGEKAEYYASTKNINLMDSCIKIAWLSFGSDPEAYNFIDNVVFDLKKIDVEWWSYPNGDRCKNCYRSSGVFRVITSPTFKLL